ncbi:MAG: GNAT family N-acetyltransferase [Actinomycetota bacterium]|nr:GNAT family N-acetyltransferase [Actinomycetota bacterium]
MTPSVRPLSDADSDQVWALGRLAFGGDPARRPPGGTPVEEGLGSFDEAGRLVGKARLRAYEQWWGGRSVPMGGLAGVAVHPDARGKGVSTALLRAALGHMQNQGQVLSVLFPTALEVYRPLGWELVGSLDETPLPTAGLRAARAFGSVTAREATASDVSAIHSLYTWHGRTTAGLLSRTGPEFPAGAEGILSYDVVAVAEDDRGALVGYAAYDRGRGYGPDSKLWVGDFVARDPAGAGALLRSIGSWDSVAPITRWRGATDDLAWLLPRGVPLPDRRQPWMLRIVDAERALSARGYPLGVTVRVAFTLLDPVLPRNHGSWSFALSEGKACLESIRSRDKLPVLDVKGLALLYAGAADTTALRRVGYLDGDLGGLDPAFPSVRPRILDYF